MDKKVVRRRQRLFRYAVDTFIELLEQVTKRKCNFKCNDSDVQAFNNFVEYFGSNIGEEFIRDFVEYGIQSWFNTGTQQDYSTKVRISWIFGKPAIKRWHAFSPETNKFIVRSHIKRIHDYKITAVKKYSKLSSIVNTVRQSEENYKERFLNTKRGYAWCIANTTLYFHKSMNCMKCVFKNDCKQVLEKEYNKVYKLRGYGE